MVKKYTSKEILHGIDTLINHVHKDKPLDYKPDLNLEQIRILIGYAKDGEKYRQEIENLQYIAPKYKGYFGEDENPHY
jgi:hypothetical protein